MKVKKQISGITLIALVVTIIILLILAGVTINLVLGEDGIIAKAQQAEKAQKLAEYKDKIEIAKATVAMTGTNYGKVPMNKLVEELGKQGITAKDDDGDGVYEIKVLGIDETIKLTQNGNTVQTDYPENITGSGTTGESQTPTVTLNKNTVNITVGETTTLTATVSPSNATNSEVTWSSSNHEIASVENGVVTAKKSGIVTISATAEEKTVNCTVTVAIASGQVYLSNAEVSDLNANTKPYLPTSNFEVLPTENTLEGGLVIREKPTAAEQTNEYVWIEVPTTIYEDTTYNSSGNNKPADNTETAKIVACLKQYTATYRNGTTYDDIYDTSLSDSAEVSANGGGISVFDNETEYNKLKNKMLASVYDNGGFWIGRYEAGIGNARTEADKTQPLPTDLKPLSQKDKQPLNYVTRNQAQALATRILPNTATTASATSSLMFGVQWDLVLKYLEVKGAKIEEQLNSDSSGWGNYNNYNGPTVEGSGQRTTTGKSINWSANNIYDLAGNVWEWTLDKTSNSSTPCASMGGYYGSSGTGNPANYRGNSYVGSSGVGIGFRVSLY